MDRQRRYDSMESQQVAEGPTDRNLAVLETAFLPLEAATSVLESGNVQLRVLDGAEAILVEDRPLFGSHTEQVLRIWISDVRKRLEELGYQLDPQEAPAAEAR
jgi:hypothetical protein